MLRKKVVLNELERENSDLKEKLNIVIRKKDLMKRQYVEEISQKDSELLETR